MATKTKTTRSPALPPPPAAMRPSRHEEVLEAASLLLSAVRYHGGALSKQETAAKGLLDRGPAEAVGRRPVYVVRLAADLRCDAAAPREDRPLGRGADAGAAARQPPPEGAEVGFGDRGHYGVQ